MDDESVVGDESHIVAREPNGPRGESPLTLEERDAYQNLILLCKTHHKLIDDQPITFDVGRLKELKRKHEANVSEALKPRPKTTARPDEPSVALRIETGKLLLAVVGGSHGFVFENDQLDNALDIDLVGDFLQCVQDYGDLWDELEAKARVRLQFELDNQIANLESSGFLVYGCQQKQAYRIGTKVIEDFLVAYLFVLSKENPLVAANSQAVEKLLGTNCGHESEFASFILFKWDK